MLPGDENFFLPIRLNGTKNEPWCILPTRSMAIEFGWLQLSVS